ncbi:hypothetical protein CBL_02302 [Carabus blaptoides fortunei]
MKYFIILFVFAVVTTQFVQGQAPPQPPNGTPQPPQGAQDGAPMPPAPRPAREISAADVEDISEMDSDFI